MCKDKQHADLLITQSSSYYGTASVAFIEYIQSSKCDIKKLFQVAYDELLAQYKNLHGQASRVAKYFALMRVAGDIAIEAGILPQSFKPKYYTDNQFSNWRKSNLLDKELMQVVSKLSYAIADADNWFIVNEKFAKRGINMIGVYDNDAYYLLSELTATKLYKKTNFNQERKMLQSIDVLSIDRTSIRICFSNEIKKMYKINKDILDDFTEDKE